MVSIFFFLFLFLFLSLSSYSFLWGELFGWGLCDDGDGG